MSQLVHLPYCCFFFFNDTATTEIYTLSLHDALPISPDRRPGGDGAAQGAQGAAGRRRHGRGRQPGHLRACRGLPRRQPRSEEHTSELQSLAYLVCRLLLEKKKQKKILIIDAVKEVSP